MELIRVSQLHGEVYQRHQYGDSADELAETTKILNRQSLYRAT